MNRKQFYDAARSALGSFEQSQVDGFENILNEGESRGTPLDHLAYILATVWHETAFTMQPVTEYGSDRYLRSKRYWPFIGRGYVQLTWLRNYRRASKTLGIDLVKNPELANDPKIAVKVLFTGMTEGWFEGRGRGLSHFLDGIDEGDQEDLREFSNARRTVNVMDRAVSIGKLALTFEKALRAAQYGEEKKAPAVCS